MFHSVHNIPLVAWWHKCLSLKQCHTKNTIKIVSNSSISLPFHFISPGAHASLGFVIQAGRINIDATQLLFEIMVACEWPWWKQPFALRRREPHNCLLTGLKKKEKGKGCRACYRVSFHVGVLETPERKSHISKHGLFYQDMFIYSGKWHKCCTGT